MKKVTKLIPNRKYRLKHNGQFSHCVGVEGFVDFSKNRNSEDTLDAIYIGTANVGVYGDERAIFYSPQNKFRTYVCFGVEDLDYIVKELG